MRVQFSIIGAVLALLVALPAWAAGIVPNTPAEQDRLSQQLDKGRIGIVTGGPGGTYLRLGSDLARLMDRTRGDALRVIVQEGRGSVGNLRDLLFLKYVDLALVQADVLESVRTADPQDYDYLHSRIGFVARFHPEVIHVIARGGPFASPADLAGKRIAIGRAGSGTQITAPIVLKEILGINAEFVAMGEDEALAQLLRGGDIDALVYVAGRGSSIFTGIDAELRNNIQANEVYFVPFPEQPPADSPYIGVTLSDTDYSSFIAVGETVKAWAVPAVLAAYDWSGVRTAYGRDRDRRLGDFIEAFFSNAGQFDDGPGGFNDNWCGVDLAATVGGWTRIPAARQWLSKNSGRSHAICGNSSVAAAPGVESCGPFRIYMEQNGIPASNPNIEEFFKLWKTGNPGAC